MSQSPNTAPIIMRESDGARGAYRVEVAGAAQPAELTWRADTTSNDEVRIADHTFTPPQARGQGIALKLVEALVADAGEQGFRVRPVCPYVAAQFDRHPEWRALRA